MLKTFRTAFGDVRAASAKLPSSNQLPRFSLSPAETFVFYWQTTSVGAAHAFAMCCLLYPVLAAIASSFRMDSFATRHPNNRSCLPT